MLSGKGVAPSKEMPPLVLTYGFTLDIWGRTSTLHTQPQTFQIDVSEGSMPLGTSIKLLQPQWILLKCEGGDYLMPPSIVYILEEKIAKGLASFPVPQDQLPPMVYD